MNGHSFKPWPVFGYAARITAFSVMHSIFSFASHTVPTFISLHLDKRVSAVSFVWVYFGEVVIGWMDLLGKLKEEVKVK